MKNLIVILFVIFSTTSFAQSAGKGSSEKSGSFFSHLFRNGQKPRPQMSHFSKKKKDLSIKDNGTLYIRTRKSKSIVDGSGYGIPSQHKIKKRERKRIRNQNH